jgi:hypothetical protein
MAQDPIHPTTPPKVLELGPPHTGNATESNSQGLRERASERGSERTSKMPLIKAN